MLNNIPIDKVLFLDIETVPVSINYEELFPKLQELWSEKTR